MNDEPLPTLSDKIAEWLGFQLPTIPMPQTVKNLDKAVGKILLAVGENAEARIKANTGKAKAKGKIAIDGLYRTEEEKRKIENRAAIVQVAVDEMNDGQSRPNDADAKTEIDDDWLNMFARIAEDKSSEELKNLFGRILAGEIRSPGSFSLRTIQFLATLSKSDAHEISNFFSYAIFGKIVPTTENHDFGPPIHSRILMEELGLASNPSAFAGLAWNIAIPPNSNIILSATGLGILIINKSSREIKFQIECQILSKPAQELITIANPPSTEFGYLKAVSQILFEKIRVGGHAEEIVNTGTVAVHVGPVTSRMPGQLSLSSTYKASMPGQSPPT
jgi:hypothetical protein